MSQDNEKALKVAPADLAAELQRVLDAMSQEEADAIIGEATDEYKLLGGAMRANYGLLWAGMKHFGLSGSRRSRETLSKNLILMNVIVHYAYAMGIREGQRRENEPTLLEVIAYCQRNSRWSGIPLGASRYTIGNAGCAVTAVAMLGTLAELGLTPGVLTERLNGRGGFTKDGRIIWAVAAAVVDGLEFIEYSKWHKSPADIPQIREVLSGGPQVLQVDFKPETSALDSHFVLGLRMTDDGEDIEIIDPWTGKRGTLLGLYGQEGWDLARAISAMAEFRIG